MPELPEVETIKEGLLKTIVGKKITKVEVLRAKSFKGNPKEIIGGTIKSVSRRAKLLIIEIPNSQLPQHSSAQGRQITNYLLVHLKMTGQLVYRRELKTQNSIHSTSSGLMLSKVEASKPKTTISTSAKVIDPEAQTRRATADKQNSKLTEIEDKGNPHDTDSLPNKYTRVIINLDDGSKLFFNDLRVFGWMKVKSKIKDQRLKIDEIVGEKYGPEPFSKEFTTEYLKEILSNWGRPIKLLLMDQQKIAGVGNIYANEALFCAGIAPHHRGRDVVKDHPEKVKKLYDCILKVLQMGIKYGGSTALDDAYRNIEGERGKMQQYFNVYGREGKDCPNKCGHKIRRMKLGGRGTFFCPVCQR